MSAVTALRRVMRAALPAIGLLLGAGPTLADGNYTLQLENDRIADTDRHYTTGFRASWVSDSAEVNASPEFARDILNFLYRQVNAQVEGRIGLAIGQNIFTPDDIDTRAVVRDDRPYAGWLYGGISAHAEAPGHFLGMPADLLDIGVVGPLALGEEVQNGFHGLIGVSKANGWDNQLENEPGVMLIAERRWRPEGVEIGDFEVDIIPHAGVSLGNVMTLVNAGATVRFGQDLAVDFGPPHVRPTLSGLAAVRERTDFAWYVFAGAEGRFVVHNIFLDGNTFADSHSVDKKPFVADIQLGVAVVINDIRFAFTHVFRTREFDGQRRADRYGAASVSARF